MKSPSTRKQNEGSSICSVAMKWPDRVSDALIETGWRTRFRLRKETLFEDAISRLWRLVAPPLDLMGIFRKFTPSSIIFNEGRGGQTRLPR